MGSELCRRDRRVPFAFVNCVWAAWVVGVEVVFTWDRDEGAGTYAGEVELGCEGRQVGSPGVAQGLGESEVVFG